MRDKGLPSVLPTRRNFRLERFRAFKMRYLAAQKAFPVRLANYLTFRCERRRMASLHYAPPSITVDLTGDCRLHCPSCWTGLRLDRGKRGGRATIETLSSIIDCTQRRVFQINFGHLGDPLLNDDFYTVCRYAVERGLWTYAQTNLNYRNVAKRLVDCRLSNLVISCDGATQEVYQRYRRGGDVELVFESMREVAAVKKDKRTPFPWITAKFIVFDHNWHEMARFQQRAKAAGADDVLFTTGFSNGNYATGRAASELEFSPDSLTWTGRKLPRICSHIWDSAFIDFDGSLLPCCYGQRDEDVFAVLALPAKTFLNAWNSPKHRKVRQFFMKAEPITKKNLPSPCSSCEYTRNALEACRI